MTLHTFLNIYFFVYPIIIFASLVFFSYKYDEDDVTFGDILGMFGMSCIPIVNLFLVWFLVDYFLPHFSHKIAFKSAANRKKEAEEKFKQDQLEWQERARRESTEWELF